MAGSKLQAPGVRAGAPADPGKGEPPAPPAPLPSCPAPTRPVPLCRWAQLTYFLCVSPRTAPTPPTHGARRRLTLGSAAGAAPGAAGPGAGSGPAGMRRRSAPRAGLPTSLCPQHHPPGSVRTRTGPNQCFCPLASCPELPRDSCPLGSPWFTAVSPINEPLTKQIITVTKYEVPRIHRNGAVRISVQCSPTFLPGTGHQSVLERLCPLWLMLWHLVWEKLYDYGDKTRLTQHTLNTGLVWRAHC